MSRVQNNLMPQENFSIPKDFVIEREPAPSLADLFAASDRIGDKYLSPDEIQSRDADLAAAIAAIDQMLKPAP
jgi:hypothetical protein